MSEPIPTCPECRDDEFGMRCVVHRKAPSLGILDAQTHPQKLRIIAILRAVFPDEIDSWNGPEAARFMGQVEDVLAGRGALFSRKDREAIEVAAQRIPEVP